MEENYCMEWKWNGRKLPVWNLEKSSSVPFHTMPYWLGLRFKAPVCDVVGDAQNWDKLRSYTVHKIVSVQKHFRFIFRGGVEDTRLEAKIRAKNKKKSEANAKAKDSHSEDRHFWGQGQECSRPRPRTKNTSASALKKKTVFTKIFQAISKKTKNKKRVFTKIFQAISKKKRLPKNFSGDPQNFNNSKNSAVLEPRTGQFLRTWGLEAKAKDFKMCPRGQGRPQGLHLCLL